VKSESVAVKYGFELVIKRLRVICFTTEKDSGLPIYLYCF